MLSWEEIDDLPQLLDKNIYFVDKKFKAPILAKDIVYHMKDLNDPTSGINRGFLVTKDNKQIWRYNGGHYEHLPDDHDRTHKGNRDDARVGDAARIYTEPFPPGSLLSCDGRRPAGIVTRGIGDVYPFSYFLGPRFTDLPAA